MKEIAVKALAKINLGLDVVRKREDGYHEVKMVMQTIHLFDRLVMKKTQADEITITTNLTFLPTNENNLVYKAAKLLKDEFSIKDGIHVKLHTHVLLSLLYQTSQIPLVRFRSSSHLRLPALSSDP